MSKICSKIPAARLIMVSLVASLFVAGCAKPQPSFYWQPGSLEGQALTATTQSLVLTSANDSSRLIGFNWPEADFGYTAIVTYSLEFDQPSDTLGPDAWGKAVVVLSGNNIDTATYLGVDFNAVANSLSMVPGTVDTMLVRVREQVLQNNGSTSTIPTLYTNVVTVLVTPYGLSLYVPGAYQGWNPAAAPTIAPFSNALSYVYEGYVYMATPGVNQFKYTSAPDFNHINYGDGGNGTLTTNGLAGNLSVPDSGYYELTANLQANTWTANKTVWGIIGDATPGGWSTDTEMTYDAVNQVWTVTCNMVASGSWKFRANDQWVIDFGVDSKGNLAYSDNPIVYNASTNNITVPADGNYTITLDLHVSGKYTYHAQLN